jgi:hypothetical protein
MPEYAFLPLPRGQHGNQPQPESRCRSSLKTGLQVTCSSLTPPAGEHTENQTLQARSESTLYLARAAKKQPYREHNYHVPLKPVPSKCPSCNVQRFWSHCAATLILIVVESKLELRSISDSTPCALSAAWISPPARLAGLVLSVGTSIVMPCGKNAESPLFVPPDLKPHPARLERICMATRPASVEPSSQTPPLMPWTS